MNKILEKEIIDTIKSNKVVRRADWGVDTYNVLNKAGKEIISVANGWDYGMYAVSVNGQSIANVEWYANSLAKKTEEQQSVFNIIDACICRMHDQEKEKQAQANIAQMTEKDKAALMFLQSMQKTR